MTNNKFRDLQIKASQVLLNMYQIIEDEGMDEEETNFFMSLIMQKLSTDLSHNLKTKEDK